MDGLCEYFFSFYGSDDLVKKRIIIKTTYWMAKRVQKLFRKR